MRPQGGRPEAELAGEVALLEPLLTVVRNRPRRRHRRCGGRRSARGRPSSGPSRLRRARVLDDDARLTRSRCPGCELRLVDHLGVEQRAARAGVGQRNCRHQGVGVTWLVRVRSARSAILRAMPARLRSRRRARPAPAGRARCPPRCPGGRPRGRSRCPPQVDARVDDRVRLERLDRGQREEGQERQLDALTGLEAGLGLVAQPGDLGDVGLEHGRELRGDLERLGHPGGDHLAQPGQVLGLPRTAVVAAACVGWEARTGAGALACWVAGPAARLRRGG